MIINRRITTHFSVSFDSPKLNCKDELIFIVVIKFNGTLIILCWEPLRWFLLNFIIAYVNFKDRLRRKFLEFQSEIDRRSLQTMMWKKLKLCVRILFNQENLESILQKFFFCLKTDNSFSFFANKLGHFITIALFFYDTNWESKQQKSENAEK